MKLIKYTILLLLVSLWASTSSVAQNTQSGPTTRGASLNLTDGGANSCFPYKVTVSSGSLSCSGGTASLTTGGGVSSTSNSDGSLTISPTTGAVVASLAPAHSNTWTGQQIFNTTAPQVGTATVTTPAAFDGSKNLISGSYTGNTTKVVTNTGTNTQNALLKWDANANAISAGLIVGTLTDGDMCTYTASGTAFNCNTAVPTGYWTLSSTNLYSPTTDTVTTGVSSTTRDVFTVNADGVLGSGEWIDYSGPGAYTADANTVTLLHFDGTNGSTTFTDSENTPKTFTANGGAVLSTSSPVFGTASGSFISATSSYITTPDSADFHFGSGNWTVDFWARRTATNTVGRICGIGDNGLNHWSFIIGYEGNDNNLITRVENSGGTQTSTIATGATDTNWHHYALVNNGGTVTTYLDGTSLGTQTLTGNLRNPGTALTIGREGDYASGYFNGKVDEFRISNVARWTTNFTPNGISSPRLVLSANGVQTFKLYTDGTNGNQATYTVGSTNVETQTTSNTTLNTSLTMSAQNIVTDTSTGTIIGTGTTQKLGFFNATPVVQQGATTDLGTVLSNLGLRASGTAYPITTSGAVTLTGTNSITTPTFNGQVYGHQTAPTVANNDCGSTTQGTIGTKSTDIAGKITVGTIAVTSCAITFNTTWSTAPFCVVSDDSHVLAVQPSTSTTKLTITALTNLDSDNLTYVCMGGN
jgi:hypothetical protein